VNLIFVDDRLIVNVSLSSNRPSVIWTVRRGVPDYPGIWTNCEGPRGTSSIKKLSLNAKGELLYLTVCDDDDDDHHHHHYHYENNNNTITIIKMSSNNSLKGK